MNYKNNLLSNNFCGIFGEFIALLYLKTKFYYIVAKRYKNRYGEIDIIASKGNFIIFVEVKTRIIKSRKNKDLQLSALSYRQSQRIRRSAEYFMKYHKNQQYKKPRFDLILVINYFPFVVHCKNFW